MWRWPRSSPRFPLRELWKENVDTIESFDGTAATQHFKGSAMIQKHKGQATFRPFRLTRRLGRGVFRCRGTWELSRESLVRRAASRDLHFNHVSAAATSSYASIQGGMEHMLLGWGIVPTSEASNIKLDFSEKACSECGIIWDPKKYFISQGEIHSTPWQRMWNIRSELPNALFFFFFTKENTFFPPHLKLILSCYPETDWSVILSVDLWVTKEILKRSRGKEICNWALISPILITLLISHTTQPLGTN